MLKFLKKSYETPIPSRCTGVGQGGGRQGGGRGNIFFKSNLQNFTSNTKLANLLPQDNKCCPEFGFGPLSLPHLNSEWLTRSLEIETLHNFKGKGGLGGLKLLLLERLSGTTQDTERTPFSSSSQCRWPTGFPVIPLKKWFCFLSVHKTSPCGES